MKQAQITSYLGVSGLFVTQEHKTKKSEQISWNAAVLFFMECI